MINEVSPEEARKRLQSNNETIYLDVRSVPEFVAGHPPGSLNIPVADKNVMTGRMDPNPRFLEVVQAHVPQDARVIVGCNSGGRSALAVEMMTEAGYQNVVNMVGGYMGETDRTGQVIREGWTTLGYPVERGEGGEKGYRTLAAKVPE